MKDITENVKAILEAIEGTPLPDRLVDTPARVQKALEELLDGYSVKIDELFKVFELGSDQLVIAQDIDFTSLCEHHCLLFFGQVHIAYLPNKKVIGASKLPRIVLAYSHRLQIQERIAENIAESIMKYLEPKGVCVVITAKHSCISCRGVKSTNCKLTNSIMLGAFRDNPAARAEVLALLKG